mmetsp:Transcript_6903/g.10104  ORF Transcript_6903/g.10104 Transcript_6903/m.10104 type:complete len:289 (-) Transcript_6903:294-1160(-)
MESELPQAVTFAIFMENPMAYTKLYISWVNFGIVLYAAAFFFALYVAARILIPILVKLHPRLKSGYDNMSDFEKRHQCQVLISEVHAIWATIASISYIYKFSMDLANYEDEICALNNDTLPRLLLQVGLGYFIADLTAYFFTGINAGAYLSIFHHVVIIFAYGYCLITHIATFPEVAFLTCEISTIFLHARYFMKEYNILVDTIVYPLTQMLFALTFFLVRILYSTYVMYGIIDCVYFSYRPHLPPYQVNTLVLCAGLFWVLQYVWFMKIVQIFKAKIFGKNKKKKVE